MFRKMLNYLSERLRLALVWIYMQLDSVAPDPMDRYSEFDHNHDSDLHEVPSGVTDVNLHKVEFGDLNITCPACGDDAEAVMVGLGVREDDDEEEETNLISTVGVVIYPCSDVFYSSCLTEKVAKILNAEEQGNLRLGMFLDLISCEEHGVEHPGQN